MKKEKSHQSKFRHKRIFFVIFHRIIGYILYIYSKYYTYIRKFFHFIDNFVFLLSTKYLIICSILERAKKKNVPKRLAISKRCSERSSCIFWIIISSGVSLPLLLPTTNYRAAAAVVLIYDPYSSAIKRDLYGATITFTLDTGPPCILPGDSFTVARGATSANP